MMFGDGSCGVLERLWARDRPRGSQVSSDWLLTDVLEQFSCSSNWFLGYGLKIYARVSLTLIKWRQLHLFELTMSDTGDVDYGGR